MRAAASIRRSRDAPIGASAAGGTARHWGGLSTVWLTELLVEGSDPRRTTAVGFAPFSGTTPLAASIVAGLGAPLRYRSNSAASSARQQAHHEGASNSAARSYRRARYGPLGPLRVTLSQDHACRLVVRTTTSSVTAQLA